MHIQIRQPLAALDGSSISHENDPGDNAFLFRPWTTIREDYESCCHNYDDFQTVNADQELPYAPLTSRRKPA
ncbi:MAG: hypothetical protein R3C20_20975 [Planctomycetaceae bacterium]